MRDQSMVCLIFSLVVGLFRPNIYELKIKAAPCSLENKLQKTLCLCVLSHISVTIGIGAGVETVLFLLRRSHGLLKYLKHLYFIISDL